MDGLDNPTPVEFPLRGEWTVERTPAHRIPSHGTEILGQRYAYDFIRTDDRAGSHVHPAGRLRWLMLGGKTQECYGWGQPIHAATAGEVVAAVDGVAERQWLHVVRESWAALRAARHYRQSNNPTLLAGNHVMIRTADVFSLYAHLAPSSVAVTEGQRVSVGDVIGRVGHTGNSTAPHLHFQLMDSADPLRARGIPCAFAEYFAKHDGHWDHVHNGIPQRHERVSFGP